MRHLKHHGDTLHNEILHFDYNATLSRIKYADFSQRWKHRNEQQLTLRQAGLSWIGNHHRIVHLEAPIEYRGQASKY